MNMCYSVDLVLACGTVFRATRNITDRVGSKVRVSGKKKFASQSSRVATRPLRFSRIPVFGAAKKCNGTVLPNMLMLVLRRAVLLNVKVTTKASERLGEGHRLVPMDRRCNNVFQVMFNGSVICFVICTIVKVCLALIIPGLFNFMDVMA